MKIGDEVTVWFRDDPTGRTIAGVVDDWASGWIDVKCVGPDGSSTTWHIDRADILTIGINRPAP